MNDKEKRELAEKRSRIPCNQHARGVCSYGDKCQFMHEGATGKSAGACIESDDSIDDEMMGFDG